MIFACFNYNNQMSLPDDLVCHILVEYLADEPQNRLVCKKVRDELDKKYDGMLKSKSRREIMNLEAVMRLKCEREYQDLRGYLSDGDERIRRMAVRLVKSLRLTLAMDDMMIILARLLEDARSLGEFNERLRMVNLRDFRALQRKAMYINFEGKSTLVAKYCTLAREARISSSFISYYRAYSAR